MTGGLPVVPAVPVVPPVTGDGIGAPPGPVRPGIVFPGAAVVPVVPVVPMVAPLMPLVVVAAGKTGGNRNGVPVNWANCCCWVGVRS